MVELSSYLRLTKSYFCKLPGVEAPNAITSQPPSRAPHEHADLRGLWLASLATRIYAEKLSAFICVLREAHIICVYPRTCAKHKWVWALPVSLAATQGICQCRTLTLFSFPPGTEMFHFPGFPSRCNIGTLRFIIGAGFPIRKSPDQRLLGTSPRLIAATPRPSSASGVEASTEHPW